MNKVCTLLFLRKGDEILLAMKKRGFGIGHWNGAGGKIELGETVEQAMIRETQEEIEVTPTTYEKVAEHNFLMDVNTQKPYHIYVHAFIAHEWEGEPSETEEMAPKWFSINEIPYDSMWEDDPIWLPLILDGKKVIGEYTFDSDNKMLTHKVEEVNTLPGIIPSKPTKVERIL